MTVNFCCYKKDHVHISGYNFGFMAIKKSQLYSSIWKSCDELRGSMDASQYKDYILVMKRMIQNDRELKDIKLDKINFN